jgi:hypothetical protein
MFFKTAAMLIFTPFTHLIANDGYLMMLFQLQKLYSTEWDEKISQYVPI